MRTNYFKNKKVTVMGLGLLGRGVGDVEFLARNGAEIIVTDLKGEQELAPSVERLRGFENVSFRLGEHVLEDFRNRDLILKAAGVPLDSPYINEARSNGIPIEMSAALFVHLSGAYVIGVTGTRGKSTVTHLIYDVFERARRAGEVKKNIFLGGNVKGVSTLAFLDKVAPEDVAVLELDSWQLQGFGESHISPDLAVFTTFMPDHLDYYKNDLKTYFADKANIYLYQHERDALVTTKDVVAHAQKYGYDTFPGRCMYADDVTIPELCIPGAHNEMNARLAKKALLEYGVSEGTIDEGIGAFGGVPGRLEKVREWRGMTFWNDTTATTPQAAIAALNALRDLSPLVVIAGGSKKGIDAQGFADELAKCANDLILLPGTGTEELKSYLKGTALEGAQEHSSMQEAVQAAVSRAEPEGTVLLSPGFASFGLFENEFDRGEQFIRAVTDLT